MNTDTIHDNCEEFLSVAFKQIYVFTIMPIKTMQMFKNKASIIWAYSSNVEALEQKDK
jgi:hypothetical protein